MKFLINGLRKATYHIISIIHYMGFVALSLLLVDIVSSVAARYLFNHPFNFALEVSMCCMVLIIFLPLAASIRDKDQPSMNIIVRRISPKWQNIVAIFCLFIAIITCILLTISVLKLTINSFSLGLLYDSIPWLPYFIVHGCMFLGLLIMDVLFVIYLGILINSLIKKHYIKEASL